MVRMKKKIRFGLITAAVLGVLLYVAYIVFYYFAYDGYQKYFSSYNVEEGSAFEPIAESNPDVENMVLVAENKNYKLYTNTQTTEIALWNKQSKTAVYSNPQNCEADSIAGGVNASELLSTLVIQYFNSNRQISKMNNYDMSIVYGQYEIESIAEGLRYIYTLENPENSLGIIPEIISEERMQSLILSKLSEKDAKDITSRYRIKDGYYHLSENATKNKIAVQRINQLLKDAGYTVEDYAIDMEGITTDNVSFTISLEYRLVEDGMKVSIPADMLQERGGAKIYRIDVLKLFGAGSSEEEGSLFVPNGSGSLINFNNGKTKEAPYSQYVYGMDIVSQNYLVVENTETARMPVFGICREDQAVFAVIEEGDALANIKADVAGRLNSYNYVYASFSLREMESLSMFGVSGLNADIPLAEKELYDRNFTIHYTLLTGQDANYSGMAAYYRNKLETEGRLPKVKEDGEISLFLEILGGVETKEHFLGVPYNGLYVMTSFGEADEIAKKLHEMGVDGINMIYKGWFNGGIYHDVADKIKILSKLGGKKELEKLAENGSKNGDKLFLDTAFQRVPVTSSRFNSLQEASKYYSGYLVSLGSINPSTMRQGSNLGWYDELFYYVMSPKFLSRYVKSFIKEFKDIEGAGLSLQDLGDVLSSDKKRSEIINRQEAKEIVCAQADYISNASQSVSASGGNAYIWSGVDALTDVPMGGSNYHIVDEHIPFYEMVIHGRIDYSGSSWNLKQTEDDWMKILKYIEYGAMPKYTMTYRETSNIKYTSSANQYSTYYMDWCEDAVKAYDAIRDALEHVANAEMLTHEKVDDSLVKVVYGNGITIYINYGNTVKTYDGITVNARSYALEGAE